MMFAVSQDGGVGRKTASPSSRREQVAVFVSGRGTNLQALINSTKSGALSGLAEISFVVSSSSSAPGLDVARRASIDSVVYPEDIDLSGLLAELARRQITFIALAGYLRLVEPDLVRRYRGRILNIHPSLVPRYAGKGMYGMRIHRAVIEAGEIESGVTVHLVDEEYDSGKILAQKKLKVAANETPESLAERLLRIEHELYPATLARLIRTHHTSN